MATNKRSQGQYLFTFFIVFFLMDVVFSDSAAKIAVIAFTISNSTSVKAVCDASHTISILAFRAKSVRSL